MEVIGKIPASTEGYPDVNRFEMPVTKQPEHISNSSHSLTIEDRTNLRVFKEIVRSQLTYAPPTWSWVPPWIREEFLRVSKSLQ